MPTRARPVPGAAAPGLALHLEALRRAALWTLLGAKLVGDWGVQWDVQWHVLIGRDSFWIPPHVMTYAGVTLAVIASFGVLVAETWGARRGHRSASTVRLFGLHGTRGYHVAAWGIGLTVLAAPIDDLWHRLFGLDVTLWSPPHLLGLLGAAVNSVGCLVIAREAYPAGSRGRLVVTGLAGAALYADLHVTLLPANRLAYLYGGVVFFSYPMLAAVLLPAALVAAARLSGRRWAPLVPPLVVLAVAAVGGEIARAGFAWLRPVSVVDAEIARDPTSPIAVAHAITRRAGTTPGVPGRGLHPLGVAAAALMVLVDARRRPRGAAVGFGVALFALSGWALARHPAFADLVPGGAAIGAALGLAAGASWASGLAGRRLADAVAAAAPDPRRG